MLQILTSPKPFFEACAGQEPSLKKPALIILLMAVLSGITGYLMGEIMGRMFSGIAAGIDMSLISAISAAGGSFLATWFMWLVAAVVLLIMVKILKGSGSFKRYAEITGYSFLPLLIGTVISVCLSLYYLPRIPVSPVKVADPGQIQAAMTSFMQNPVMQEYMLLSTVLSIIFLIWGVNICAIGLEKCCNLTSKQSLIAAGVPVALYIIYSVYTLVTTAGLI